MHIISYLKSLYHNKISSTKISILVGLKNDLYDQLVVSNDFGKKSSILTLIEKEYRGKGSFGEVSKIECEIGGDKKKVTFAMKEYFDKYGENSIKNSLKVHKYLKSLGITTWKTYRRILGKNSILMSLGDLGSKTMLSTNENNHKVIDWNALDVNEIYLTESLNSLLNQINLMTTKQLRLSNDAYMLLYDYSIDRFEYIIGDFDIVSILNDDEISLESLYSANIHSFINFLINLPKNEDQIKLLFMKSLRDFLLSNGPKNESLNSGLTNLKYLNYWIDIIE